MSAPPLPACPGNPGRFAHGLLNQLDADGEVTAQTPFDLVLSAAEVLRAQGLRVEILGSADEDGEDHDENNQDDEGRADEGPTDKSRTDETLSGGDSERSDDGGDAPAPARYYLRLPDFGWSLWPALVSFEERDGGGFRTATTMQSHHPALRPQGLFEYQYSLGEDFQRSVAFGFEQWAGGDLRALLDATRDSAEDCMAMEMSIPADEHGPARRRRILLGPVNHYRSQPREAADADADADGHDDFCPCCLFTQSLAAFEPLLRQADTHALRLFAARGEEGELSADCRLNGEEWPLGEPALRDYAAGWPGQGMEFRKQYVVLQTLLD